MFVHDTPFRPIPLKDIKPNGWMKTQLRTQAEGLLGNLDKIFQPIKDNPWLCAKGQDAVSLPVWLNGFIALAFLTDDNDMQLRAKHYIKTVSENASEHKWLMTRYADDSSVYALSEMLNAYILYYDSTLSEAVEPAVSEALAALDKFTDEHTLSGISMYRWYEAVPAILWLYKRTNERWLQILFKKLEAQGFDWIRFFSDSWPYENYSNADMPEALQTTAENNASMLRCGAILSRIYNDNSLLTTTRNTLAKFEEAYTNAVGAITGDAKLVKANAACGADLSAVTELMRSMEYLMATASDTHYADKLELLAFNAYPAAFSSDMWAHQYTSQSNQVQCSKTGDHVFSTDKKDSNTFGMFDNAATVVGGFASYAAHTAMKTDNGISIISYVPCQYDFEADGKPVTVECIGEYPFRENITIRVSCQSPTFFALELRIPEWADDVKLSTGGDVIVPIRGTYYKFEGSWSAVTDITVSLRCDFRLERRPNELWSVRKGPIIFAMPVNGEKSYSGSNTYPYSSYELTPSAAWNFAICAEDKRSFAKQITFEEKPITNLPFSNVTPALEMYAYGKRIQWPIKKGTAVPRPMAAAASDKKEMLRFVPYGATDLRIAELPTVR